MQVPNAEHTARDWHIHQIVRDFRLEDVWALPTPGGPEDFPRLIRLIAASDPSRGASRTARALFAIRWKLGAWLGWDAADAGLGVRVPTLRERLPADLRDAPLPNEFGALPFTPLYLHGDEFAAEIANRTVHAVLHLGWVRDAEGDHRGEMAVYARPNGRLGTLYMAAIRPFRHWIVYPALLREIDRGWRATGAEASGRDR
jgi:hypothetical protein